MGSGFTNTNPETGISRPPSTAAESAFMPPGDERRVRKLVAQTLPSLADRPFVDKRLCWFADTTDSEYISDFVPDTLNSFVVVSGDSGHGFKMLPIVGVGFKTSLRRKTAGKRFRASGGRVRMRAWRAIGVRLLVGELGVGSSVEFRDIRLP